ncbi:MAG: ABC transporter permease subunit [Chloroflexi bacterium]|nr:ABC transporter permease subunit [Chloroflexota bacterium]
MTQSRRSRPLFYFAVVVVLLLLVLPLIAFMINAFAVRWFYPQFIPQEWSLDAWERIQVIPPAGQRDLSTWLTLLGRSPVINSMGISLLIGGGVTVLSIIIGLPAARVLGLHQFRGKRIIEFLILAPTIVPVIAFSLGLNINFIRWGLSGTPFGVALVHLIPVMPYVVLTLSGVFANYNPEFEAQARTLGAGPIRTFWYVTLPAIMPGIVVAGLFAFLVSWSQYLLTFLIGGGRVITLPLLLFSTASGGNNAITAAMSLIFIAPAVLTLLFTSRYLSGNSGAVGGFGRI